MSGGLRLPIKSHRYDGVPFVPVITELEPVVEAVITRDVQDLLIEGGDEESDINAKILQARINAERNRLMSMDTTYSDDPPSPEISPHTSRRRIRFGSESEFHYDDTSILSTQVRDSKRFDGNRSGRPPAKA